MNTNRHADDAGAAFRNNPLVIAQEAAAVEAAENYLAEFQDGWASLPAYLRGPAVKLAQMNLTTLAIADPVRAAIWLEVVAFAAGLPVAELQKQVNDRATVFQHAAELNPKQLEAALCAMIL